MKRISALLLAAFLLAGCVANPPLISTEPATTAATQETTAPTEMTAETTTEPTTPTEITTEPTTAPTETTQPPAPQIPTLLDFLKIATQPVGNTMYIWGGGWNEEDTAAGIEATTLGLSPNWAAFAGKQNAGYNYKNHRYRIHDGLDCSGYVGWAVYNTLETENGRPGYVYKSTDMSQKLADRGLGSAIKNVDTWQPGDIVSMKGHIWIALGQCADGSVLLLHSSPPGVMFSGTLLPDGSGSDASRLAEQIMQTHYPLWYARYPESARSHNYLKNTTTLRWSAEVLADPQGIAELSAEEVTELLFETKL